MLLTGLTFDPPKSIVVGITVTVVLLFVANQSHILTERQNSLIYIGLF